MLLDREPSFWQRLRNFINTWDVLYYWGNNNLLVQQYKAEKYFGSDIPPVIDVMKNMSILLVNDNPILAHARPELPNAIFFTSFHISKTPPPLTKVRNASDEYNVAR